MFIDSYSETFNAKVPVRVINLGTEDVWLHHKSRIGKVHEAEITDSFTNYVQVTSSDNEIQVHIDEVVTKSTSDIKEDGDGKLKLHGYNLCIDANISSDQKRKLMQLLQKHKAAFSKGEDDLGYPTTVKHHMELTDKKPTALPHRRIPPHLMHEVKQRIKKFLDQNVIRPSPSPYGAVAVLVRKKDKSLRLCIDFRLLNSKNGKDAFPLPRIEESLDAVCGSKYNNSIDLAQGYYQVALDDESIPKTAFRVGFGGLFEYLRMPMGLFNSPGKL